MPLVASIIAFIQLAIKAAPTVKQVYEDAKNLIDQLVKEGAISVEQQAELHAWADAHMKNVLEGTVPPEMVVVPDLAPETPPPAPAPETPLAAAKPSEPIVIAPKAPFVLPA